MLSSSTIVAPAFKASFNCSNVSTSISIKLACAATVAARASAGHYAASGSDVVLLDQNGVEQAYPVVKPTTRSDRVLLRQSQAR